MQLTPIAPQIEKVRFSFPKVAELDISQRQHVVAALVLGFGVNTTFNADFLKPSYAKTTTLCLLKRAKHPIGLFQPPGGKIDNEDLSVGTAASRECSEELRFGVIPICYLGETPLLVPGVTDNKVLHHVLCVTRSNLGPQLAFPGTRLSREESLTRKWVTLENLFDDRFSDPALPSLVDSVNLLRQTLSDDGARAQIFDKLNVIAMSQALEEGVIHAAHGEAVGKNKNIKSEP